MRLCSFMNLNNIPLKFLVPHLFVKSARRRLLTLQGGLCLSVSAVYTLVSVGHLTLSNHRGMARLDDD